MLMNAHANARFRGATRQNEPPPPTKKKPKKIDPPSVKEPSCLAGRREGGEERKPSPSPLISAGTDGASSRKTIIEEPPFAWSDRAMRGVRNTTIKE